ncbi:MAG: CPBP family glutamic-type intramembrane protease [Novosphingobium sp.]|uniref:CPBP family glutamic-type intramembrane protease n=1 Tax=Novosphingobium sp. TaxID=1874826 RepID=UPI003C7BB467
MTTVSPSFRAALTDFAAFLRRPQLLAPAGFRAAGNARTWLFLTLLSIAVLLGLILPFIHLWQGLFDLPDPQAFDRVSKVWLVPIVVLIAPLLEELLFRGWQNGTRSALWLLACALAVFGALAIAIVPGRELIALGAIIAAAVAGLAGWIVLRRNRTPLAWFGRAFPFIFYAMAALFALVHLANYDRITLAAVPLVLPQFWAGLLLGYVRQRIGLLGSIAAHALSNLITIGLALLVSSI